MTAQESRSCQPKQLDAGMLQADITVAVSRWVHACVLLVSSVAPGRRYVA